MRALLSRIYRWLWLDTGSTRAAALYRIFLSAVLWSKYGRQMTTWYNPTIEGFSLAPVFFVFTFTLMIGLWTRVSAAIVAILSIYCFHWIGVEGGVKFWIHHHTALLLAATVFLAFMPSGRSLSVDRWIALARAERNGEAPPPERGPLWGQRLVAIQLILTYGWAAYAKLQIPFLSGARMEAYMSEFYVGADLPSSGLWGAAMIIMAVSTVAIELALVVAMIAYKTQKWVLPFGVLLHAMFYVLLPVSTYSATVLVMYFAVVDPEVVHRVIDRLVQRPAAP